MLRFLQYLFVAMTCLSFFTLAGNFALAPPAVQRLFGPKKGALIFGVLFSAFGVASVGGNFLSAVSIYICLSNGILNISEFKYISQALLSRFGWNGIFRALSLLSLLAALITTALRPVGTYSESSV